MELQKKTYILVGGTGGIGLGLAKKLLGIGVEVKKFNDIKFH